MVIEDVVAAWRTFQAATGGVKRPSSEAKYLELRAVREELVARWDCGTEPCASLVELLDRHLRDWEERQPGSHRDDRDPPSKLLARLMREQRLSQMELSRRSGVTQSAVNRILLGRRGIGLSAAKRFAAYFERDVEDFL